MSSEIKYINNTGMDVTFSLCNGYKDKTEVHSVDNHDSKQKKLDNSNLRSITVWTEEDKMFMDSDGRPLFKAHMFENKHDYTIRLSSNGQLEIMNGIVVTAS